MKKKKDASETVIRQGIINVTGWGGHFLSMGCGDEIDLTISFAKPFRKSPIRLVGCVREKTSTYGVNGEHGMTFSICSPIS